MCAGDLDRLEATVDEMLEIDRRRPRPRRRDRDRQPDRLGADGEGGGAARARPARGGRSAARPGAARSDASAATPRPRAGSSSSKATVLAERGEIEAALALALRNRELTERLGDVFSRSMALTALAYVRLEAGEFAARAGGDRAGRRAATARRWAPAGRPRAGAPTLRARALLGLGRTEEALAQAEWAADTARRAGMHWQLPPAPGPRPGPRRGRRRRASSEALDEATEPPGSRGDDLAAGSRRAARRWPRVPAAQPTLPPLP